MVELKNVSKVYGNGNKALDCINLTIDKGEFVFVVGASGAGKSTFLKLIMREEIPTSGSVFINGYNLNTMKRREIPFFRRSLGIVFQDFRLIPNMEVYDNVAFAMRVTGAKERDVRKRVTYALSMVGLSSKIHSMPQELSGGEQQRVAIARALVNKADLIIADEPTGNIDPAMAIEIMELLNHINKSQGTTIIMVTHAHEIVKQYDHRVVVLRDGSVVVDSVDKSAVVPFLTENPNTNSAGYYQAPNEFEDVETFIENYGKSDIRPREDLFEGLDGKLTNLSDAGILPRDFIPSERIYIGQDYKEVDTAVINDKADKNSNSDSLDEEDNSQEKADAPKEQEQEDNADE